MTNMERGWVCPRCNVVNAPWVSRCECRIYYGTHTVSDQTGTAAPTPQPSWQI